MSPTNHADYLSFWSLHLKVPVLSINYRKAPEHPYPCAVEDVWTTYRRVIESNGRLIGMNFNNSPLEIAVVGDSAGGNLATVLVARSIRNQVQKPNGLHLIYPSLDLGGQFWKSKDSFAATNLGEKIVVKHKPELSSRILYAGDGVLPLNYFVLLGEAYFKNGQFGAFGNIQTD